MDNRFECSLKNCQKHKRPTDELHHFTLEDLKIDDIKFDINKFPNADYYYLKRPIEPERLKNIYQSAFIYDLLYNFAKEFLPSTGKKDVPQDIDASATTKQASTDTEVDQIKEKVIEFLFKNNVDSKTTENEKMEQKFVESTTSNDNIWDIDEINILRKRFSSIKDENVRFKSKVIAYEEENIAVKKKYEELKTETQNLPSEIHALETENERLFIRLQETEREFINFVKAIEIADKQYKDLKEKYDAEKKLTQKISNEKIQIEFELRKIESEISNLKSEMRIKHNSLIEKQRLKHEREIKRIKDKLEKLVTELNEEKTQHLKSQNALKHLRSHFLSNCLPENANVKIADNQINTL